MFTKNGIYLFYFFAFLLVSTSSFCQEKGILLTKKDSSATVFLKENKRVKVVLSNNKSLFGRLKIENDSTISIKGTPVSLDSIVKIKRKSLAITILTPFIVYAGITVFTVGLYVIVLNSYPIGALVSGTGISMILIPLISDKHPPNKWNYSISENPKSMVKK